MSKMDEMRAMREARYEASRQDVARPSAARPPAARAPAPKAAEPARTAEVVPRAAEEGLCGHRAISGRTCTRDKGHAAKSHRYS